MLGFLGLGPVSALAIARAEYEDRTPQYSEDFGGEIYRDYRIFFTGWKHSQNSDLIVGQWVGYPLFPGPKKVYRNDVKYPYLVASVPGAHCAYVKGSQFDICPQGSQAAINWRTSSEVEKEAESRKSKKKLMDMIDGVRDSGVKNLSVDSWNRVLMSKRLIPYRSWRLE